MKKRILILDNLEEQIQLFTRILQTANYKVIVTDNESKLLDFIESDYPDIILISSSLTDKDIYLICKKVKLLELGENIPVIFINGNHKSLDAEMLFNAGGADYINYPFSSVEILTKISNQIQLQSLKEKLQEKTNQLQKLIPYYQKLKLALEKAQLELTNLTQKDQYNLFSDLKTFRQTLEKEWLRGSRQRASLGDVAEANISLIMAQLNDFDSYEKNHEPQLIKNCLQLVTDSINSTVKRTGDLVTNFDRGKFAILLPNTDQNGARVVAEKIQNNLDSLKIPHTYSEISEYHNFSIGIANGIPTQGLPPEVLLETAENALNQALKANMKNIIEIDYV